MSSDIHLYSFFAMAIVAVAILIIKFPRPEEPFDTCPHGVDYDDCPDCRH